MGDNTETIRRAAGEKKSQRGTEESPLVKWTLIVIALAFISFAAIDRVIGAVASASRRADIGRPLRIRTLAVSVVVMSVASRWMLERYPW